MAIYKRGGIWWVDVYCGNPPKRVRRSAKTSDEHKARIVEQTLLGVNKGKTARQQAIGIIDMILPSGKAGVRLEDAAEWYRQCLIEERAETDNRTIRQRINIIRAFAQWALESTQALTADDVGPEEAFAYSQVLGERGILGKTQNAYIGDLSTAWKMMVKRSKVERNPWAFVRVRRDKDREHTGRAFTKDELGRILKVAGEVGHDWVGMVIVGAYTGLRMPDVARLKWSECDMKGGVIALEPSKTKRYGIAVRIPMHRTVFAHLRSLKRTGEYVFPFRATHPAGYKARGTDVTFAQILAAAKVGKASERDKLSFHCLRHTFVSWLARAGVAEDVRMRMAGHTNADTHAIYTHDDESARAAIDRLE